MCISNQFHEAEVKLVYSYKLLTYSNLFLWINSALKSKTKWGKKSQQLHNSYQVPNIYTEVYSSILGWLNVWFSVWHVQLSVHVFLFLSVLYSRLLFWGRVSTVSANAAKLTLCNPLQTQAEVLGFYYQFTQDIFSLKQSSCAHAALHLTQ